MKNKLPKYDNYKPSNVEWLGEIPQHWEVKRIKSISRVKRGASPRPIDDPRYFNEDGEFSWVRIADVTANNHYLTSTVQKLSKLGASLSVKIYPNELFISIAGTVGKPMISKIKCCIHDGFVYFPDNKFNQEFLYRIFETGQPYLGLGKFGTQLNLNTETVGEIRIPYPPLSEQEKIAQFLDEKTTKIDKAIEIKERQIELLKERRQILIHRAVTRGLDENVPLKDSGVEWIGEIPEHWEVKRLRYIGKCQNGVSKGAEYFGTGFPFVSYGDVYKSIELAENVNGLAESSIEDRKQYSVKEGDVFFTRTSETVEEIGFASTCLKTIEDATFAGFLIRFRPSKDILYKGFSKFYFSSKTHRAFFVKEMNLVIRASLSQELLNRMPIIIPPFEEQIAISEYLETISAKISKAIGIKEREIEVLKEYKSSLINSAVTGKVKIG